MKAFAPQALAGLVLAAVLSACSTVGPDYKVPDNATVRNPSANGAFLGADGKGVVPAELPAGWWKLYDDARLNGLVEQALGSNTSLRVANANLRRALAVQATVDAERIPHAKLDFGARRAQEAGEAYLIEEKLPIVNEGDTGLSIGYELDLFGKLARAEEAAAAGSQASQAAVDLVRVTVAAETVRAYVQGCSAGHELAVARHQLDLQNRSLAVAQRLQAAGRGLPTDVLRAQALVDVQRAALPHLVAEQDAARYRLAALLGKTPRELSAEAVACTNEPTLRQPIPVGDGAGLLKRRPDVREAERQLAAATARIGVATAELYPSIRLGVSAGFTGILEHLGQSRTERWALGPLISWTIPDSGARARVKAAKADSEAALARFDGVVLNALRETETALSFYAREQERNDALRAARDNAQKAAQDNHRLYAAGRAPYLTSLDAERTLATSEAALAASDAQLAQDQVNLFLALGGGWEQTATH